MYSHTMFRRCRTTSLDALCFTERSAVVMIVTRWSRSNELFGRNNLSLFNVVLDLACRRERLDRYYALEVS
jgi:hypothetical protein